MHDLDNLDMEELDNVVNFADSLAMDLAHSTLEKMKRTASGSASQI